MNINELNRINTVNVEAALEGVQYGSGTFKKILDDVMDNVIIPLTDNSGRIIGMSYDSKVENIVDDNIAQRKFEIEYSGKDVQNWVLKALELKADRKVVEEVQEDENGVRVVLDSGEVVEIETYYHATRHQAIELPEEVELDYDEVEGNPEDVSCIKKTLRNKYDHYLSGLDADPEITWNEDERKINITKINWGRKR